MIWYGFERNCFDDCIEVFCNYNLGLFCLFMKYSGGQRFTFVKQSDVLFGIYANSNNRVSHRIRGTLGLNLIDHFFKLHGYFFLKSCEAPARTNHGINYPYLSEVSEHPQHFSALLQSVG